MPAAESGEDAALSSAAAQRRRGAPRFALEQEHEGGRMLPARRGLPLLHVTHRYDRGIVRGLAILAHRKNIRDTVKGKLELCLPRVLSEKDSQI